MLARLDDIPGVTRSRAECSGHYFLIDLADGADDAIAARAIEVLGRDARLLDTADAGVQIRARQRGEPWLSADEARALSFVEGRMLGIHVSAAMARKFGLGALERTLVAEAVREEMFAHVERIYAGLARPGRFFEAWPQLAERAAQRCAPWLDADGVGRLSSALVHHFGERATPKDR